MYRSIISAGRRALLSAAALALSGGVVMAPQLAQAGSNTGATVGVIRWDAWTGPCTGSAFCSTTGDVAFEAERNLQWSTGGSHPYNDRIPYYGASDGSGGYYVRSTSQSDMDKDISFARRAGIDYWAFNYGYGLPNSATYGQITNKAIDLFKSSTNKNGMKYTYVVNCCGYPSGTTIASDMNSSNWMTVLKNRPLIYMMVESSYGPTPVYNYVKDIRDSAALLGLPKPYVVLMSYDSSFVSTVAASSGADAISSYAEGNSSTGSSYSTLMTDTQTRWNAHLGGSGVNQVVPWVSTGWDNRPRSHYTTSFTTSPLSTYANAWVDSSPGAGGGPQAIGSFLQNALTWISNHQNKTDANTVIMYAWNELDEGGWLTPTIPGVASANGIDRVAAVSQIAKYSSDSNYDTTDNYVPYNAFDGSLSTPWHAGTSTGYNTHWLQADYSATPDGRDVVVSGVDIAEYNNRTTSFNLEVLQGNTWKVAQTWSGANIIAQTSKTNFTLTTPMSGRAARIKFVSGKAGEVAPAIYEATFNTTVSSETNFARNKEYYSSSNYPGQPAADAFNGNTGDNWQALNSVSAQWLEVDLGSRKTINQINLREYPGRTLSYQLQYYDNPSSSWVTFYNGSAINPSTGLQTVNLTNPVVVDKVRMYWPVAGMGGLSPIIYEMELKLN